MKVYKVIESNQNMEKTEETLNSLAKVGWTVVGFTIYQILLEMECDGCEDCQCDEEMYN